MSLLRVYISQIGLDLGVFQLNRLPQNCEISNLTRNSFKNQLNPK